MTVPSSVAKSGPYLCNGVTDVFNYDFRIVDKAHLNVILADADGVETTLTLTTHYTVSDVGSDTGSINLTAAGVALAVTGTKLTILRNPPFTQETDLENQGAYLAQTVEDRLDLITMQIQTVKERSDRSIAISASDEDTTLDELTEDLIDLAAIQDDISTVAGISADVTTVAGVATDVTTVAVVADSIPAVAGVADDIPTVAGIADYIPTVATNVADITNFSDVYLGAKATESTTRNDGSALQAGDQYFDTTNDKLKIYTGSAWVGGTGDMVFAEDVLDEDDMASDSDTKVPTQQSVKAYVDGLGVPSISAGDAGKVLTVKDDESGYRFDTPVAPINVARYGADPSATIAVNQQAFVDAIAAVPVGGAVAVPDGWSLTLDQITIDKSLMLIGRNVTITRSGASSATSLVLVSGGAKVSIQGITFDGNKALNANPCAVARISNASSDIEIIGCTFRNGKASGGYGEGLVTDALDASFERVYIADCRFYDNDSDGCAVTDADNLTIIDCEAHDNGGRGIAANNYDLTLAQKLRYILIARNRCRGNATTGLGVGNFVEDNDISASPRDYGYNGLEANYGIISGNIVENNDGYGITCYGQYLLIESNISHSNGVDTGGSGGGNFALQYSIFRGNLVAGNYYWGFDCGGTRDCIFEGNLFLFNGATYGSSVPLNIGGGTGNKVHGNVFRANAGRNIALIRYEGDGAGGTFPVAAAQTVISGNKFQLDAGVYGVTVRDGIEGIVITGNEFFPTDTDLSKCILCLARSATIKGNVVDPARSRVVSPDGNGILYIPDVLDDVTVNTAATINGVKTTSQQAVGTGIPWTTITNGGSGYTSEPTVTVSGGGGSGATARARIRDGAVVQVDMETYGTGYTSAPTLSFSGGGGTGAAATAQLFAPLPAYLEKFIYFNAACTLVKAGSPAIAYPASGNLAVAAFGTVTLYSPFSDAWRVKAQVIA